MTLNREARDRIRYTDGTIAGYVRHHFPDGKWLGDSCGCTDDRCIGFHHGEGGPCGCLEVLLDEYLDSLRKTAVAP